MSEFSERLDAIEARAKRAYTHTNYPFAAIAADVEWLVAELREARTWRGLLAFLDEQYPEDVFLPDPKAPDQGPRIVWMARQLARVRQLADDWDAAMESTPYADSLYIVLDGEVSS